MAFERAFRTFLAGALAFLLASCGGGSSVVSDFHPNRFVIFGDAMADLKLGATPAGSGRYTVNDDGTANLWVLQLAGHLGVSTISNTTAKALAHARINSSTGANGSTVNSVGTQISNYLSSGFAATDLVIVSAGTSDLIYEGQRAITGAQTEAQAQTNVRTAAQALATQIKSLVDNGAKHVLVVGPYNMGRTPWATATNKAAFLETLTGAFHDELVVAINDLAENVLFVDARLQINTMVSSTAYNSTTLACSDPQTVAAGAGIGVGTGKVDSSLCSSTTSGHLVASYNASTFLFADSVYLTPFANRSLGDAVYNKLRNRW